jgi:rod shape-determining protein MreC
MGDFFLLWLRRLGVVGVLLLIYMFYAIAFPRYYRASWPETVALTAIYPVQYVYTNAVDAVTYMADRYLYLIDTAEENEKLRDDVSRLQHELFLYRARDGEYRRLLNLFNVGKNFGSTYLAAEVIWNDPRSEIKVLEINKGSVDGVEPNQAVLGQYGLIGRIGQVSLATSKVLLITDPNSSVDVLLDRSRARALLVGMIKQAELRPGPYALSRLEYLRRISDVVDGDVVVTSGLDNIFPRGIPVGKIENIERKQYAIFQQADVVPFEDMSSIEEVLIITE